MATTTYKVRVGDDGRTHLETADIHEALEAARKLSMGVLGTAQVREHGVTVAKFVVGCRQLHSRALRKFHEDVA